MTTRLKTFWKRSLPSILSRPRLRSSGGQRIYAIGDIHGCYDLLVGLLDAIGADSLGRGRGHVRLIVLGDFIDRGGFSREVVDALRKIQTVSLRVDVLLGNHERSLLMALNGHVEAQAEWLEHGGYAFLDSYGIPHILANDPWALADALAEALGEDVIDWFRSRPVSVRYGRYLFCHAGIKPGVPISAQNESDMLSIREEFMQFDGDHGAIIVHGHNRVEAAEIRPNRVSLDTRGYETGILSAAGIEGDDIWLLSYGS